MIMLSIQMFDNYDIDFLFVSVYEFYNGNSIILTLQCKGMQGLQLELSFASRLHQ